jgi:hypothetical protein
VAAVAGPERPIRPVAVVALENFIIRLHIR